VTFYRACGLTVASDRALPELTPVPHGTPDWTIRSAAPRRARHTWFRQTHLADGRRWLSVAHHDGRYTLRFSRLTTFEVAPSERVIRCMPEPATAPATVRHLLLDQVLPMVAGSEQRLALHASAVAAPRGAVAFLGDAGRGKSTVAALLATGGWPLICDDCLLIEQRAGSIVALPGYPGVRLFPDTLNALFGSQRRFSPVADYTPKRRVAGGALPFCEVASPLRRLYVMGPPLTPGRRILIAAPRTRRQAMMDVLRYLLCLDVRDREWSRRAFELTAGIVDRTEVRSIRCSWNLSRLAEIREALEEDVAGD
jgi:hypothetical protein